jgi:uncharacterized repeat protein (TIGR03803 family)
MTKLNAWKIACVVFLLLAVAVVGAYAQDLKTVANFSGANGAGPEASLIQGTDGNLYGTTFFGGRFYNPNKLTSTYGVVFGVSPSGRIGDAYRFCPIYNGVCADGANPISELVEGTDGNLYGTTPLGGNISYGGGSGTVFRIASGGVHTILYSFCSQSNCMDGSDPFAGLVQATNGNFYGTTSEGGPTNGGTLFEITPGGVLTTLYDFEGGANGEGQLPMAALIQASDGDLYGTTAEGGSGFGCSGGCGTVFKVTLEGKLTVLYSFCSVPPYCADGSDPVSSLVQGSDGNFYGTTYQGGLLQGECVSFGCGTVFKITPEGAFTTLHSFCDQGCVDGVQPTAGLIQATDGNFYGTTSSGAVFEITPEGAETVLYQAPVCAENGEGGCQPMGGLMQATNGLLYGTTYAGGNSSCTFRYQVAGCGTVFRLNIGAGPFVTFLRGAAKVGKTFGILGQRFRGTTSVVLNGIPASFTVKSDAFLEAIVPGGATTGFVTVATPTGTLTSNVPFHVIK